MPCYDGRTDMQQLHHLVYIGSHIGYGKSIDMPGPAVIAEIEGRDPESFPQLPCYGLPVVQRAEEAMQDDDILAGLSVLFEIELYGLQCFWRDKDR